MERRGEGANSSGHVKGFDRIDVAPDDRRHECFTVPKQQPGVCRTSRYTPVHIYLASESEHVQNYTPLENFPSLAII